jgi:hypothetical protein
MTINKLPTIYIGYDPREDEYAKILKYSIEKNTKDCYNIVPLEQDGLRRAGLYFREMYMDEHGQRYDRFDGKPLSTQFSFSRFLVPALQQYSGRALFMDCDMYLRSDITELFDTYHEKPFHCVKHSHVPNATVKMDNIQQFKYFRKNWSSLMLFNFDVDHTKALHNLTHADVSTKDGLWLHSIQWMQVKDTGDIDEKWNWLDGHSSPEIEASNVHFTTGGPIFDFWTGDRAIDNKYADEWRALKKEFNKECP